MLTALFALLSLAMMVSFFGTDADNQLQGGAEEEGRCSCAGDTKDLSDALKCLSDAINGDSSSRQVLICILKVMEELENHPLVIGLGYWSCCPSAVAVMEEDGWYHRDESGDCDSKVRVFYKHLPKDFFSDSNTWEAIESEPPDAHLGRLSDHITKHGQMAICGMTG